MNCLRAASAASSFSLLSVAQAAKAASKASSYIDPQTNTGTGALCNTWT
jgi:hypothetical protein